jgi:beta-phosphoglucomutase family hydrolase
MSQAGVIFDLDGVVVLTESAHWQSWQAPAQARGVKLDYAKFLSCFGQVNPDCIRILFGPEIPPAESASIADEKEIAFRDIIRANVPLSPGIGELLKDLKSRGVRTAIGSSAPPENIALVLDAGKLRPMFDAIVDGSQVKRGKPAPDVFLMAGERIGVPPKRCSVIEDAPMGIAAAVAAGMLAIGVATTHGARELNDAGAKFVFDQPKDLISDRFFRAIGVME